MDPKVIKTEAEYEAALAIVEELWDVEPGTPQGDLAELWTVLVEQYEEQHFPIDLPDPISAIKFRMEQAGLKNKDLVPYIGGPSKISEVLNGKRGLSLSMIRALHNALGIPAEVLLGETKQEIPEEIPGIEWGRFPLAEMLKRDWFTQFGGSLPEARHKTEQLIREMSCEVGIGQLQPAMLRCNVRSGSSLDEYALLAWQLRIHSLCEGAKLPEYNGGTITPDFIDDVVHLSSLDEGPQLAREFLENYGIHLIFESHLPKTHLDGAAMWHLEHPVVALTLRYDRLDNFWFTLVHELAHLALHLVEPSMDSFMDDLEKRGNDVEDEADNMATECLIAGEQWAAWYSPRKKVSPRDVHSFAKRLRIHPSIVAGRIRRERDNYRILNPIVHSLSVRETLGIES